MIIQYIDYFIIDFMKTKQLCFYIKTTFVLLALLEMDVYIFF